MRLVTLFIAMLFLCSVSPAFAETKIVVWNVKASLEEKTQERLDDFKAFAEFTDPDVIILVEMSGESGVESFVSQLSWDEAYYVTSDLATLSTNVFFALEMAVISKIPIESVIEYDTSLDGVHPVRTKSGKTLDLVREEKLVSDGIPHFGQTLSSRDRGTIRVDLENGLSIFPVHLKSNRVSACSKPRDALRTIEQNGFDLSPSLRVQLENAYNAGFAEATAGHISNAQQRERVIAAIARVAQEAIDEDRHVVITGDFNTSYEEGKKGDLPSDCTLKDFSCEKAPFPANACSDGDGFDDTFAILEKGYAASATWNVLSKAFPRTYDDTDFADVAIDHIAIPASSEAKFSNAQRIDQLFGSDHYPITVTFVD